jgi:hypothetical protein
MQQQQQMYILFQDSRVTNEVIIETINRLFALNATVNNNNSSTGATTEMFLNLFTTLKILYFKTSNNRQQRNMNSALQQILTTLLCSEVSEQR